MIVLTINIVISITELNLLLQVEWKGELIIALCSKTYIAVDSLQKLKISAKGINHATLRANDPLGKFWNVLQTMQPESGVNKGFRAVNGQVYTYSQEKSCLPYFYCKRYVHEDGIFTSCLDLTLCPVPKKYVCLQSDMPELAPDFKDEFRVGEHRFICIKQALIYFKQLNYNSANHETLSLIKRTSDTYELDRIGKTIPFVSQWCSDYRRTLETIVTSRLKQFPNYYDILSTAGNRHIVNAERHDNWAGVGENVRTTRWCPEAFLRGRNILGRIYIDLLQQHNEQSR